MNGAASGFAALARRSRWWRTAVATTERCVAATPHPGMDRPPAFQSNRRTRLGWPRATLPLLLAAALSCNARVDSIDLAAVQRDLQTIRNAEHQALATRNLDAAYAPYAPDWTLLEMDGTRFTLPQERAMTEQLFHYLTAFRGVTTVESVRALDHGIVLAFDRSDVEMDLLDAKSGRPTTLRFAMTAEVLWRQSDGRWLAYRTRILSRRRWVDGVLDPRGRVPNA